MMTNLLLGDDLLVEERLLKLVPPFPDLESFWVAVEGSYRIGGDA